MSDENVERNAFAAHMRKRNAYEYVYWNGAGQPSAKRPDTPYGEGWVPCDEQWAAWLTRAALPAATADAREGAWKAMVEALTFYADGSNYMLDTKNGGIGDQGALARAALALAAKSGGRS